MTTDLRARKPTVVIMTLLATYTILGSLRMRARRGADVLFINNATTGLLLKPLLLPLESVNVMLLRR